MRVEGRVSLPETPALFARLRADLLALRRAQRKREIVWGVVLFGGGGGLLALGIGFVLPPLMIFGLIGLVWGFIKLLPDSSPDGHPRLKVKVAFFEELVDLLRDDVAPGTPIKYVFDLGMYDEASKVSRTARSGGGRQKTYYTDRWLRLVFQLADGSVVRVLRHAGVKTKSGSVVRESRRLDVSFAPRAGAYGLPSADFVQRDPAVRKLVDQTVRSSFPNPPEGFAVRAQPREGRIEARLLQEDTDFRPIEVMAVLWSMLSYMAERRSRA